MKILTWDNRTLYLYKIGDPDTNGSDKLYCTTDSGDKVIITWGDVLMCFGSYLFQPK
ncbi:MAG: hypothetical protein LBH91_03115 [Prevotellaceae bacterium]|jgi:hypothetical protein|nr:hypothetical protein [Prevotellaceae bacterium]